MSSSLSFSDLMDSAAWETRWIPTLLIRNPSRLSFLRRSFLDEAADAKLSSK
jgi:hypothetical protein